MELRRDILGRTSLAAMLALVGPLASTAGATTLSRQATSPLRPSFDLEVRVPPTPVPVAGTPLLVYELHLANFAREALVLDRVDVLDTDEGTVIAAVRGDALDGRLARPRSASADVGPRTIAPGMHAVLYLEIAPDEGVPPRALEHRIAYHVADEDPHRPASVRSARVRVRAGPPVVLGPPLRGGPWAAVYDPSWERGHRRVVYAVEGRARIPGRFAIDWLRLDGDGRLARGDEDAVGDWHGYGADVLAVADGVVAATRDDVPESATLSGHRSPSLEDATGNYVALEIGDDRYVFYEHLVPGSVRVEPGERVRRGQVIGALGFTGSSTGPHLHFHVADANSPLGAEGVPFVLESFDVLGAYDDFAAFGEAPWTPLDDATRSRRTGELPAPNVVIEFEPSESPHEPRERP